MNDKIKHLNEISIPHSAIPFRQKKSCLLKDSFYILKLQISNWKNLDGR